MHVYELYARHRGRRKHRARNCVWNVVEFQIEENARAKLRDLPHRFRSSTGEQLAADLEHAYKISHLFCKL